MVVHSEPVASQAPCAQVRARSLASPRLELYRGARRALPPGSIPEVGSACPDLGVGWAYHRPPTLPPSSGRASGMGLASV